MFRMTLSDLRYRARRVGLVTLLVALVLTLLYLMTGLAHHLKTEPQRAVAGIDAPVWVLADGVSGPFTAASVLPLAAAGQLAAISGEAVEPFVVSRGALAETSGSNEAVEVQMFGHRPGALGSPKIVTGESISGPGEIVLDDSLGIDVGADVTVGIEQFRVVGLTSDSTVLAGQAFSFIDLGEAQRITFQNNEVVTGFLSAAAISPAPDGFSFLTADDVAEETLGPIESAVASIDLIRILLWFVAAIVMGAVIYLTALERERDFAVLKAVGASGSSLGAGLALQAVIVALLASILGAIVAKLIEPVFPLPVTIPSSALLTVPLVAVIVGLVSALLGVRKVNRTDPAEAFG